MGLLQFLKTLDIAAKTERRGDKILFVSFQDMLTAYVAMELWTTAGEEEMQTSQKQDSERINASDARVENAEGGWAKG